jgi:hypothetical protein
MYIAKEACIPREVMDFLLAKEIIADRYDLRLINMDELPSYKKEFDEQVEPTQGNKSVWTIRVSGKLKFLIEWFNSYHRAYGHAPQVDDLTHENFLTLPEELKGSQEGLVKETLFGNYSMSPARKPSNITSRKSYGSISTFGSQAVKRRNVKVSISEYPKFSGKAKDWIAFERKFRSVASSQGFDRVLQDKEFIPQDDIDEEQYAEDLTFIYDAFQNCWADSMNFYLVEQNKKTKDGRRVYLDAKNYFRGTAVEDAIMTENMDELINYKLTHSTLNGAEGYNNKFNDIVNSLEQQGHVLEPKILKGIYLGNIKDKVYENIKDNAATTPSLTLPEVQAQILRKYIAVQGERRIGAPQYMEKRYVNTAYSKHVKFKDENKDPDPENGYPSSESDEEMNDPLRTNYATKSKRPSTKPNRIKPPFPLIPQEDYNQLPDRTKEIIRQQHAYFRDIIKSVQSNPPQKPSSSNRSQHLTISYPEEPYEQGELNLHEEEGPTNPVDPGPEPRDPIMDTFNQFLQRARQI